MYVFSAFDSLRISEIDWEKANIYTFHVGLLWRSPEQLRARAKNIYVSPCQKDDVYSFAIILHEIMSRQGAWGSYNMEPKEIVAKVNRYVEV